MTQTPTKLHLTMAQTKRRRRTKHRGTAAGSIETRGRTGRPPSADEKRKASREALREQRLNRQPTWNSSAKRAGLASALMFAFLLLTSKGNVFAAVMFAVVAFGIYVPSGYYLETFLWKRRQRKKAIQK
jgi:Flp pilus assembly protein TadB